MIGYKHSLNGNITTRLGHLLNVREGGEEIEDRGESQVSAWETMEKENIRNHLERCVDVKMRICFRHVELQLSGVQKVLWIWRIEARIEN